MPFTATWMDLEIIILSEVRQREISLICGMWKNETNELFYKAEIDSQTENKLMVTKRESGEGINWEFGINRYTLLYVK